MTIYKFITPSDPITFKAPDDKTAFAVSLIIGNGKAGTKNTATGESLPSLLLFNPNVEVTINEFLGMDLEKFIEENKEKIKLTLMSFAYGDVSDRIQFDEACEAITEPDKLQAFKASHEDRNRSSVSGFVKYAWDIAERLK